MEGISRGNKRVYITLNLHVLEFSYSGIGLFWVIIWFLDLFPSSYLLCRTQKSYKFQIFAILAGSSKGFDQVEKNPGIIKKRLY